MDLSSSLTFPLLDNFSLCQVALWLPYTHVYMCNKFRKKIFKLKCLHIGMLINYLP